MRPRTFQPASFITPSAIERLRTMPLHPWDVMTSQEFTDALGVKDRMLINRWLYRGVQDLPPLEPPGIWKVGAGSPRVIRKDRAVAWAMAEGKPVPTNQLWPMAANVLSNYGWPNLKGAEEVENVLALLITNDILPLARGFSNPSKQYVFYPRFEDDKFRKNGVGCL